MKSLPAALLLFNTTLFAQTIEKQNIHSANTNDDYEIIIRKPEGFSAEKSYHIIYVADGSIKLGNYILGTDKSWAATVPKSCVIVAIAHIGDWHTKRSRDFIPSDAGGYSDKNFGHAQKFYLFLKNELIPLINKKFTKQKDKSFIGHSFSRLFCLYTLFQPDKLFDNHFAISPSVWANYRELLKIEENFSKKNKTLAAKVMLQAGGLEVLNKVLSTTNEFYNTTKERNYAGYSVSFSTVNNANHFSMIKPGADKILATFKD
jgi:predicted alpha/beta superfamily hydrolase